MTILNEAFFPKVCVLNSYLVKDKSRRHLPELLRPAPEDIEKAVHKVVASGRGVVNLSRLPAPDLGPYEVQMRVDSPWYFLSIHEYAGEGEMVIRRPVHMASLRSPTAILGDLFPMVMPLTELAFAVDILQRFSRCEPVPPTLMR